MYAGKKLNANTYNNAYKTDINGFKYRLQELQRSYIRDMSNLNSITDTELKNTAHLKFISNALNLSRFPLSQGINVGTVAKTIGYFNLCTIFNPYIKNSIDKNIFNILEPYAQILSEKYPDTLGKYYNKCILSDNVLYTPETAVMDEIALGVSFFDYIYDAPEDMQNELIGKYNTYLNNVHHSPGYEDIPVSELVSANHRIVTNLVMHDSHYRRYFSNLHGLNSVDFTAIKHSDAILIRNGVHVTTKLYEPPDNGFTYIRTNNVFNKKFEIHPEYIMSDCDSKYLHAAPICSSYKLQQGIHNVKLCDTTSDKDLHLLADIMYKFIHSMDSVYFSCNEDSLYNLLKEDPDMTVQRFIKQFSQKTMTKPQQYMYDLLIAVSQTDAPVISDTGRLVATRCIGDYVSIGQEGGVIRGTSIIEPGAWVDKTSFVKNSNIGRGVILCMNSSVSNSDIKGTGIMANTQLTDCIMRGTYDPFEMRREHGSDPAKSMSFNNKNVTFKTGNKKDNMNKNVFRFLSDFLDKNIRQYTYEHFLENNKIKNNDLQLTAEEKAQKDRDSAMNQHIAIMGQKIAHLEDSSHKAAKAAARTETKKDDAFVNLLRGKLGEQLVCDLSVTLDMIDKPLNAFDMDMDND